MEENKFRKSCLAASLLMMIVSLFFPAIELHGALGGTIVRYGYELLLLGIVGFLVSFKYIAAFSWLANLFLITTWVFMWSKKNHKFGRIYSWAILICMSTVFIGKELLGLTISKPLIGYYLWLSSGIIIVIYYNMTGGKISQKNDT